MIRPTLPSLDAATFAASRQLAVDVDVVRYTLSFGRSIFTNWVGVQHRWTDGNDQDQFRSAY